MNLQLLGQIANQPSEQRLLLDGVSWQQYETLLAVLGDDFPNLRLSFLEGKLEIMTTSPEHEELKTIIAMLLEAYFQETRTRFHGIGAATFRKVAKQRGLEPDECYCLGTQRKEVPDIAIEIVLTSGLVDKLEIYRGLGMTEVWQWRNERFSIYHLRSLGYEVLENSELLPNLNFAVLTSFVNPGEQFEAVMAYREAIRASQS
jgi:Uma2 family endonuclease